MIRYNTTAEWLRAEAGKSGIPLRSLADVQKCLSQCQRQKSDEAMARLMLKHGRLTDEARAYVAATYPEV